MQQQKSYMRPLSKGVVRLYGPLGDAMDRMISGRLKRLDYPLLTEPFRLRNESDGYWRCEFWGKTIRSLVYAWRSTQDQELAEILRKTVAAMLETQTPDGRITSYPPHMQLKGWDIWGRKYVLLGLLAYYQEFEQDPAVLKALTAMLDDLLQTQKNIQDCGEHFGIAASSILRAIVEIGEISGDQKYIDAAKALANTGCCYLHNVFDAARIGASPSEIADGKAYELTSCFQGLCALFRHTGDAAMQDAVIKYFEKVRDEEIFITGCGGLKDHNGEFWYHGKDRQMLRNAGGMGETCVTVTWIWFCENILKMTGSSIAADEIERSSYNALLGSLMPDGSNVAHINPFLDDGWKLPSFDQIGRKIKGSFDGHDCCRAQAPYGFTAAPMTAVMETEGGYAVNLYENLTAENVLHIEGNYPLNGYVRIVLDCSGTFELALRIPTDFGCKVNGETVPGGSYYRLQNDWQAGDVVEMEFDMTLRKVTDPSGKWYAYCKGPLLMCRETLPADSGKRTYLQEESGLVDYASAGMDFSPENNFKVWIPVQE